MPLFSSRASALLLSAFVLLFSPALRAVSVHGTVTDSLGAPIPNATVALVQNGKVLISVTTHADGTFQLSNAACRPVLRPGWRQILPRLTTGSFYGGEFDSVEQNIVLEPEWVRQSIVVTATGLPEPQAQVSASVSVINKNRLPEQRHHGRPASPGTRI